MEEPNAYITVIQKKIRNLKKKLSQMDRAEAQRESGTILNSEQLALLSNRPFTEKMLEDFEQVKASMEEVATEKRSVGSDGTKNGSEDGIGNEKFVVPGSEAGAEAKSGTATDDALGRLLELFHVASRYRDLSTKDDAAVPPAIDYLAKCLKGDLYVVDWDSGLSKAREVLGHFLQPSEMELVSGVSYQDVAMQINELARELSVPAKKGRGGRNRNKKERKEKGNEEVEEEAEKEDVGGGREEKKTASAKEAEVVTDKPKAKENDIKGRSSGRAHDGSDTVGASTGAVTASSKKERAKSDKKAPSAAATTALTSVEGQGEGPLPKRERKSRKPRGPTAAAADTSATAGIIADSTSEIEAVTKEVTGLELDGGEDVGQDGLAEKSGEKASKKRGKRGGRNRGNKGKDKMEAGDGVADTTVFKADVATNTDTKAKTEASPYSTSSAPPSSTTKRQGSSQGVEKREGERKATPTSTTMNAGGEGDAKKRRPRKPRRHTDNNA